MLDPAAIPETQNDRRTIMSERFITLWRRADSPIDWDFYVSESEAEAGEVMDNLAKQKIPKATTYRLGEVVPSLSTPAPSA